MTWLNHTDMLLNTYLLPLLWKLLGAVALWIAGGWGIKVLRVLARRAMSLKKLDPTLRQYADSALHILLRALLVIAIMAVVGIETTSFAALLAAAGVALGMAWSGLLSNVAAGVFLMALRPFRVGNTIVGAGVSGEVQEIGLFATTLDTADKARVTIPNNKLFNDVITNHSICPVRRIDIKLPLRASTDLNTLLPVLLQTVSATPGVVSDPPPGIRISDITLDSLTLTIGAYAANSEYGNVQQMLMGRLWHAVHPPATPAPAASNSQPV
jgi:small conductance mechanosensitive channel